MLVDNSRRWWSKVGKEWWGEVANGDLQVSALGSKVVGVGRNESIVGVLPSNKASFPKSFAMWKFNLSIWGLCYCLSQNRWPFCLFHSSPCPLHSLAANASWMCATSCKSGPLYSFPCPYFLVFPISIERVSPSYTCAYNINEFHASMQYSALANSSLENSIASFIHGHGISMHHPIAIGIPPLYFAATNVVALTAYTIHTCTPMHIYCKHSEA